MIENIAAKVQEAELQGKKIAMFHYQILINAKGLKGLNAVQFCKDIGVPVSYATEFRKMITLANLMQNEGVAVR